MTETVSEMAKALAAAQSEMTDPIRAKVMKVPGRPERMYAGLDDLLRCVRPVLSKHGIAISQVMQTMPDGKVFMVSQLRHTSGEVISSCWEMSWKGSPQDKGSEASYARRYSLEALVGVAATFDDDAESVSHPEPQATQTRGRGKNRPIDTTPSPGDQRLADEVAADRAAKAQAAAARKAAHHTSWPAAHKGYAADIAAMKLNVAIAFDAIGEHFGKRPSQMDNAERMDAIQWLRSNDGALVYDRLVSEREQT